ncbi:hypothetical protein [Solemya pervernicosa gill symbiont]|nr:hypothetical protein [Solemya pervernicosa gill symbiont]
MIGKRCSESLPVVQISTLSKRNKLSPPLTAMDSEAKAVSPR